MSRSGARMNLTPTSEPLQQPLEFAPASCWPAACGTRTLTRLSEFAQMTACGPGARHRIGPGRFPWSNGCGRETASRPSDLIVTRVRPSSGRRRPAWAVAISRPRMSTRHGRRAATCKPFTCSINPFTVANMRGRSHSPPWGGCPSTTGRASAPIRAIVASWRATRSTTTTRPATAH